VTTYIPAASEYEELIMKGYCRPILTLAGSAMIVSLLTIGAPPAHAQGTFPLQCRGGGQANMKYDSDEKTIYARFRPAPGPAGNGLAPGQCSWLDRAFRPGEPSQICQRNITRINFFWGASGGYTIFAPEAAWVYNMPHQNLLVTVNVYNEGTCMRVVK
jgi:hypothetical protein